MGAGGSGHDHMHQLLAEARCAAVVRTTIRLIASM